MRKKAAGGELKDREDAGLEASVTISGWQWKLCFRSNLDKVAALLHFFLWTFRNTRVFKEWVPLCEVAHPNTQFSLGHGPVHTLALPQASVVGMDTKTCESTLSWWVIFCSWIPIEAVGSCFWGQGHLSWEWNGAGSYDCLSLFPFVLIFSLFGKLTWKYINSLSPIILPREGGKGRDWKSEAEADRMVDWAEVGLIVVYKLPKFSSSLYYSDKG